MGTEEEEFGMTNKMQEIREHMDQMKIKKALIGGYNKEDVQLKFDMLYAMFEKIVKEQEKEKKQLVADFERCLQELAEEKALIEKEQVEMKSAYKTYCEKMLGEYKIALRSLSGEFSKILEDVSKIENELQGDTIFDNLALTFEEKSHEAIPVKDEIVESEERMEE